MSNTTVKKALRITSKVLTWIIIAVTVFMMIFTLISTLTFDRNDRNLFGIRFYIVLSDSMSLGENNQDEKVHFNAGDIVLSKIVDDPHTLEAGDVISFISQNSDNFGETVTHKIRRVEHEKDGSVKGYVTYGTYTGKNDEALVQPEYVLGVYAGKLPGVGHFFSFLKTTPGYISCILVPFLLLILWQGVNTIRLFKRYKREQMEDIEAERAQIALEREQSAQMMKELQALKEQLAQQAGVAPAPAQEQPAAESTDGADQASATPDADTTENN